MARYILRAILGSGSPRSDEGHERLPGMPDPFSLDDSQDDEGSLYDNDETVPRYVASGPVQTEPPDDELQRQRSNSSSHHHHGRGHDDHGHGGMGMGSPAVLLLRRSSDGSAASAPPPPPLPPKPDPFEHIVVPDGAATFITRQMQEEIVKFLPSSLSYRQWNLVFCTKKHGISIHNLFRRCHNAGPLLMVVQDMNRVVFGTFIPESLRSEKKYYGTGQTFVFTFKSDDVTDFEELRRQAAKEAEQELREEKERILREELPPSSSSAASNASSVGAPPQESQPPSAAEAVPASSASATSEPVPGPLRRQSSAPGGGTSEESQIAEKASPKMHRTHSIVSQRVNGPIHVFMWSARNDFFIYTDERTLAVGGGGSYALVIDGDMFRGSSHCCSTFNSPPLASKEDFLVRGFQLWSFADL
uniref:Oxidation resistance protein 1 n=1 Tax=Chromera velia CCMP2878 TaxID=1169474 RepID=A0A0G4I106_9ALVE|mmetsp:Transcript_53097/g.103907  ORF Transcript_53097/g.103907 Transcript_53097/m.103907 type:complete len:417 (+) Transcript_53097:103-1353(+)|eukprot:Cvel_1646.t1-p1 / transcript=Cvel_1646.t1 / gene=Cvel_1646 / organism=Chromera_velia_CCMP2878 / gene_product=Uncharacterized protein C20orf118 homolog, putative / transcript_product=Uncharacterized protein C20orf118 homolog, putative / location=Cvel_scaffold59:92578-93825(-) / protein_length=416 / sequence_SO=supercontig / SO=protein_coding / is_pseudo=false